MLSDHNNEYSFLPKCTYSKEFASGTGTIIDQVHDPLNNAKVHTFHTLTVLTVILHQIKSPTVLIKLIVSNSACPVCAKMDESQSDTLPRTFNIT